MVGKLRDQPDGSNIFSWRHTCNYLQTITQIKVLPASLMYTHLLTHYTTLQCLNDSPKGLYAAEYRALIDVNSNKCKLRSAS
jgi:hypothetical protein